MSRIGATVTVDVDTKSVLDLFSRMPDEVAAAANAVSYDLHNNKNGFIRRRLISRAGRNFNNPNRGRRFVAAALDRAGGSYHRLPGRVKLSRINGETFTIDEVIDAFAGNARPAAEPMFVPMEFAKKGRGKRYFKDLLDAARGGDIEDAGMRFVKVGGKLFVVRRRARRSSDGRRYDFIAQVRRQVRRPQLINVAEIFSDLDDKLRSNYVRELRRRLKALEQGQVPPAGSSAP